jgi:hypothetical protein
VASISDVLAGYLADETFPGVKDLKPVRENAEYLYGLKQREDALADRPTMLVVGGIANATGALAWLSRHTIGNRSSDLVVEITSSVPAGVGAREERCDGCDHFSYSEKDQRLHYAEDFIRTLLL